MRKFLPFLITCIFLLMSMGSAQTSSAGASQPPAASDENAQLRQEVEQMKKAVAAMEERLAAQEEATQEKAAQERKTKSSSNPQPRRKHLRTCGHRERLGPSCFPNRTSGSDGPH